MCREQKKQHGDVNDLNKEVKGKPLGHIYHYFGMEIKKKGHRQKWSVLAQSKTKDNRLNKVSRAPEAKE